MLKILHTADWHIGKNLHKVPMQDQFAIFFDWLIEIILNEEIDLLLVSGDVFDYANPAAEDRKMYYSFLKRLVDTKTKIIITGGNHDSAGFLNAPKQVLKELNIDIIGEACEDINDEIIELRNQEGEIELVVAAVPFLKDKDLRNRNTEEKFESRTEAVRHGITKHYGDLSEIIKAKYPTIPSIAMGHLYAIGAEPSESEREIHMGNQAAIGSSIFESSFDYVALGHIHRPQVIGKNEFVRYSGSPVPLSFSEKEDKKCIIILEIEKGRVLPPRTIEVPKSRKLQRVSGSLEEVIKELDGFKNNLALPAFVELVAKEKTYSSGNIAQFESLKSRYEEREEFVIVKSKIEFLEGAKDINKLFEENEDIEDLKPADVFSKKLEVELINEEDSKILQVAFLELLEMVRNED